MEAEMVVLIGKIGKVIAYAWVIVALYFSVRDLIRKTNE